MRAYGWRNGGILANRLCQEPQVAGVRQTVAESEERIKLWSLCLLWSLCFQPCRLDDERDECQEARENQQEPVNVFHTTPRESDALLRRPHMTRQFNVRSVTVQDPVQDA